jgi:hypothetical protein
MKHATEHRWRAGRACTRERSTQTITKRHGRDTRAVRTFKATGSSKGLKGTVPVVTRIGYVFDPASFTPFPALDESARLLGVKIMRIEVRIPPKSRTLLHDEVERRAQSKLRMRLRRAAFDPTKTARR